MEQLIREVKMTNQMLLKMYERLGEIKTEIKNGNSN